MTEGRHVRRFLIAVVLALVAALTCVATGWPQDPIPTRTAIQDQLNAAGIAAAFRNKSMTVLVPEGEYDFVSLRIPPHVSLIADPCVTRSARLRYIGGNDAVGITIAGNNGYGSTLAGFEIVSRQPVEDFVAVKVDGTINARIAECRINLANCINSIGVQVAGRESLTVERVEARATVPVQYRWGDNLVLRDCDFGATIDEGGIRNASLPSCVLHVVGMPQQITMESCSAQGGDHLVYGEVNSNVSGQGLNIWNVRWEQSTSTDNPAKAAIHLMCYRNHLENIFVAGSRWTKRQTHFQTSNVLKRTVIGSWPVQQ